MDSLLQDLRYALRTLTRNPGFAFAVVATLALGIGANTAIFSVIDGVLLRRAPMRDIDRLVMVWETDRKSGTIREPASIPDYRDFQQRAASLDAMSAFTPTEVNLTPEGSDPTRLAAMAVTHEFFPMTGLAPAQGRVFTADEDVQGAARVALISDALWTQLFDRDPAAVGKTLQINDRTVTIIGVMAAGADFGMLQVLGSANYGRGFADRGGRPRVDLWFPLAPNPQASRGNHPIFVLGRLKPGMSIAAAQQDLGAIATDLERLYLAENDGRGVHLEAMSQVVFGPVKPALFVLLGAVVLVLLVACANIANLLLVRGESRTRELSVRLALGATSRRLARQFLAESAVLTLAGAGLGVLTASFGLDLLLALAPANLPRAESVGIDLRVLGATLVVSLVVGLAFGLLPARQARRSEASLRPETGGTASRERNRLRSILVVSELSLAVMLMVGAGLLIRSLWRLQAVDPGFAAAQVLKGEFQLPQSRYPRDFSTFPNWPATTRFTDELRTRVAALPGVEAVAIVGAHPLDAGFTSSISVVGRESEAADWPEPTLRQVDAGYLAALQVPLLAGRGFSFTDNADAPPVVLINEAAKRRFFTGHEPLGAQISLWGAARTVVGVIANERMHGLAADAPPAVYFPLAQAPIPGSVLIRTQGDPAALIPAVRSIVKALDPALPLFAVEPMERTLADSMGQRRFTMIVLGTFAGVALLLAIIGVHGVLSYTVARRSREIGIRMALGAQARSVVSQVVSQGARLTALGLGIGLVLALAASRLLSRLLFGVGAADPLTFLGVALLLGAAALVASWLPARKAANTDPMIALRSE